MTPIHMRNDVSRIHGLALRSGQSAFKASQAVSAHVNDERLKPEDRPSRAQAALTFFGLR